MTPKGMSKARAIKKVRIAIDKMIDLSDTGYGCDKVSRILDNLNELSNQIESGIRLHI